MATISLEESILGFFNARNILFILTKNIVTKTSKIHFKMTKFEKIIMINVTGIFKVTALLDRNL